MRTEKEIRRMLKHLITDLEAEISCNGEDVEGNREQTKLVEAIARTYWVLGERPPKSFKLNPGRRSSGDIL